MPAPIHVRTEMQFISVDENGKYAVDPAAVRHLQSMGAPLTVVSVIGRYRTGKSSLLNGLVGSATFATSSTVQAQTKGILLHVLDDQTLLLDTEGLGSLEVSRDHDASIFALAMLVSSGCFFNNLGSITSQSIDDLHLSTKVAGLMCKHASFGRQLPELVWVMRDFTLELCDRSGAAISGDVYFEQCVDQCAPDKANDIRTLFPSRRCIPLPRPATDEEDLRRMQNLRPEFTRGVANIRNIIRQFPPKAIGHTPASGSQLCTLAAALCTALNANAVPDLDDVWRLVASRARDAAFERAAEAFHAAPATLAGIEQAYAAYAAGLLDDGATGDDCFNLLHGLLQRDTRGAAFEERYRQTKREMDIAAATAATEQGALAARLAEAEAELAAGNARLGEAVEARLRLQQTVDDLEADRADAAVAPEPNAEMLAVLEELQGKHKALKASSFEAARQLETATHTIRAQERMVAGHSHRLDAERKLVEEQRTRAAGLDATLSDMRASVHQSETDLAIWRTRYEDHVVRADKKRKIADGAYTDVVALTSEVNFLRSRQADDGDRIKKLVQENHAAAQQIQGLHIKLALEIGKE